MKSNEKLAPVLVVDDDSDIRRTVDRILRRAGCEVSLASDGEACLQVLRQGFHGLILMDVMMPGLDGWATIRAIREQGLGPGQLICMLTAIADPGPGNEDLAECVFDYLAKPFEGSQLLNIVRAASDYLVP